MRVRGLTFALGLGLVASCGGTTGGARVNFSAFAMGPNQATGGRLEFTNNVGYHVVLSLARLHIGAVYLKPVVAIPGAQATACYFAEGGFYTGEVLGSLDVDALSPTPQPFPVQGDVTTVPVLTGELWLSGPNINVIDDSTPILDVRGVADKAGLSYPFEAHLTIGRNRLMPSNPPFPSQNPICKQRIVTPIPANLTPTPGGQLLIRVDPRVWFARIDFSTVPKVSDSPPLYQFSDSAADSASVTLYGGLRSATTGAYQFTWQ